MSDVVKHEEFERLREAKQRRRTTDRKYRDRDGSALDGPAEFLADRLGCEVVRVVKLGHTPSWA